MKLKPSSDDLDQLSNCDMIWDQELCLVKDRQLLLAREPLNDARHLAWVLAAYLLNILHTLC